LVYAGEKAGGKLENCDRKPKSWQMKWWQREMTTEEANGLLKIS